LNLAESEREGGVSPTISPMLGIADIGNVFARCKYNMPTVDKTHTQMEFTSSFALFDFLQSIGENNALT
jgi:NADH dehydrogenase [ubiquinone] 1 alpha subcomplex assembly factor 5